MKKFSNKGFVLAETIVVAVFMVTIFSALYSNYFPIMANYEKREYYDDLDSKYTAFWLKYMMQDSSYSSSFKAKVDGSPGYDFFDCNNIINDSYKNKACRRLVIEAGLANNPFCKVSTAANSNRCDEENADTNKYLNPLKPSPGSMPLNYVAIITPYRLDLFKGNLIPNNPLYTNISDGMIDYINSLPDYTKESSTGAKYRLIIELYDNRERERPPLYKYATIEVSK